MKKKSSKKTNPGLSLSVAAEVLKIMVEMVKDLKLSESEIKGFQAKSPRGQRDFLQSLYDDREYKKVAAHGYVDFAEAVYLVGMSFYALNRYPPAVGAFYKITKLKCKDVDGKDLVENSQLVIDSNFYQAIVLYTLGKYHAAIGYFSKALVDTGEMAMCANLYLGFCYEKYKKPDFNKAELCFREVIKLYDGSKYSDKENVKEIAKGALKINLILQHKVTEVIDLCKDVLDEPDQTGQTLLAYATMLEEKSLIEKLLQLGANPFKADKYGNSPYTKALENSKDDIVKLFVQQALGRDIGSGSLHQYIDELCSKKPHNIKQSLGEKGGEEFRRVTKEYYDSEIDSIKLMGQHMDNLDSFVGDDC